jgi:hypothetical protein
VAIERSYLDFLQLSLGVFQLMLGLTQDPDCHAELIKEGPKPYCFV